MCVYTHPHGEGAWGPDMLAIATIMFGETAKPGSLAVFKPPHSGSLGGAAVWRLPLARGAILETRDRIPHRAPGTWSLLLPLPMSLLLSLSLCAYHK